MNRILEYTKSNKKRAEKEKLSGKKRKTIATDSECKSKKRERCEVKEKSSPLRNIKKKKIEENSSPSAVSTLHNPFTKRNPTASPPLAVASTAAARNALVVTAAEKPSDDSTAALVVVGARKPSDDSTAAGGNNALVVAAGKKALPPRKSKSIKIKVRCLIGLIK